MNKYKWAVIAEWSVGPYLQGQVISRHSRYDLAAKAAKRIGDHFTRIREILS